MACWAAAALLGGTSAAIAQAEHPPPPSQDQGFHLLGLNHRRRAFFKYEKRIRELSSPEKVFEYFSSLGDHHQGFMMTPSDVMRSIVPVYPPYESEIIRAGRLPGEPSPKVPQHESPFFAAFDLDSSGALGFNEWLLFQAMISIPENDVDVAFALMDKDSSGSVDIKEFQKCLQAIQSRANVHYRTSHEHPAVADLASSGGGLMTTFFDKDGKRELTPQEFKKFLASLRDEVMKLEFKWYDYADRGFISARDFALSVVGCARLKHIDSYLMKIDSMPAELANRKISFKDFTSFRVVWRELRRVSVALEFWRSVSDRDFTPEEFKDVVQRALGVPLSKNVVDTVFYMFMKPDGSLNTNYMFSVLGRHFETGSSSLGEDKDKMPSEKSFLECLSECSKKKKI